MDFLPYANLRNGTGTANFNAKAYVESLGLRSSADFQMPDSRGELVEGVLLEPRDFNYLYDIATANTNQPIAQHSERDRALNFTQSPIEGIRNIGLKINITGRNTAIPSHSRSMSFMGESLADFMESQDLPSSQIYVTVVSGICGISWSDNTENSYLNILIGANRPVSPTGTEARTVEMPRTVFGIEMPFTPKGYEPVTEAGGKPIVNITDGTTVIAQYFPQGYGSRSSRKCLYILFPIHAAVEEFKQVFLRIFDQLTRLNVVSNEMSPEILAKMKSATVRNSMRTLESSVADLDARREQARQEFFSLIKQHRDKSAELEMYKGGITDEMFLEKATKELESIKQMSIITRIIADATGRKVKIDTDHIYCYNSRTKKNHLIGRMRITIDMATDNIARALTWHNLDRRGEGRHHAPHVDESGKACLGNMTEMLPEVLASGDLSIIALLAIQFVQSVNLDDVWGRRISSFPVVDKDFKIVE